MNSAAVLINDLHGSSEGIDLMRHLGRMVEASEDWKVFYDTNIDNMEKKTSLSRQAVAQISYKQGLNLCLV